MDSKRRDQFPKHGGKWVFIRNVLRLFYLFTPSCAALWIVPQLLWHTHLLSRLTETRNTYSCWFQLAPEWSDVGLFVKYPESDRLHGTFPVNLFSKAPTSVEPASSRYVSSAVKVFYSVMVQKQGYPSHLNILLSFI